MSAKELFRLEAVPVFQNRVYDAEQEARQCARGDVILVEDESTGLIHNAAFDGSKLVYDSFYQNEQALSPSFARHIDAVLALCACYFKGLSIVEIGCGKGYFLNRLRDAGYAAKGVDPAYEGDSPHIVREAFNPDAGLQADAVVLRHVLEHVPNPLDFLADVARTNGGKGVIYIEVPCLDWIADRRAWHDVFYEHVNYFRLADFQAMFATVHEAGRLFGGQYLYVFADLATLRSPRPRPGGPFRFPPDFTDGVGRFARAASAEDDRRRAIWGAGAKGVMFAHHMTQAGVAFGHLIDINPAKQGKFIPGTGHGVLAPRDAMARMSAGDLVYVMNPNYLDEIAGQAKGLYDLVAI